MPFEDLPSDEEDQSDPGNEAIDELAGTLAETAASAGDDAASPDSAEPDEDTTANDQSAYDPQTEPAFPTAKAHTQHSVYCLPETWAALDGASGLLFETEVTLRRDGYEAVQQRELHNALLRAAAETLTAETIAETFVETRDERAGGSLLNEES
jgi:hypothetical protein